MTEEKRTITERIYRNVIIGDSIRRQALLTGEFNLLASLVLFLGDFPFPIEMAYIALVASVPYFVFYLVYEKISEKYFQIATSFLTFMGFLVLFFVIHMSGGITSPFIFLYFCIFIFENIGGIRSRYSLLFGLLSYSLVIAGEFFGFLPVHNMSAIAIYKSFFTTFIIYVATVSFMATVAYSAQLVYENVKLKLSREGREREELILKYSEIEKKSNLGIISHRVVHDMRTPLTLIKNYLIMSKKSEEIRNDEKRFQMIQAYIDRLSESMEAIVAYGRKGFDYQTRETEICEVIDKTVTVLKFYSRDINYNTDFSIPRNALAYFNPNEFYTVIFNLLKNAIDALSSCSLSQKYINISCRLEKDFLLVGIYNNGPVIPENKMSIVLKESFTTKKDGSGLGLMIVADLCQQNDAEIKIENKGEKYGVYAEIKLKKIRP